MSIASGFRNLNISAKISVGFGMVGLLFLGVISQYHTTLSNTLTTFQEMILERMETEKSNAMQLNTLMLQARRDEKDFLLRKDTKYNDQNKKIVA